MGLKMEGVGEMWVVRARGQEGEVELTIMPYNNSYKFPIEYVTFVKLGSRAPRTIRLNQQVILRLHQTKKNDRGLTKFAKDFSENRKF